MSHEHEVGWLVREFLKNPTDFIGVDPDPAGTHCTVRLLRADRIETSFMFSYAELRVAMQKGDEAFCDLIWKTLDLAEADI